MKKLLLIAFLFFVVYITVDGSHAGDNRNKTVPGRIVSLSPAITEGLYLLGLEDRIVGVTTYCRKPPNAKEKEKVGTIIEMDIEKIISMKPDLVLGSSNLTSVRDVKRLKNIGIHVVTLDTSKDFDQLCNVLTDIGRLAGVEEKARFMISDARKKVSLIRKRIEGLPRKKVLVQLGNKPLFVATSEYFINDLIEFAGGVNIFRNTKTGIVSREEVLKRNPDIIIITTMGIAGENEIKSWKRYTTINAVRKSEIHIADSNKICSPTAVSFVESLEEFSRIIHPETAKDKK